MAQLVSVPKLLQDLILLMKIYLFCSTNFCKLVVNENRWPI